MPLLMPFPTPVRRTTFRIALITLCLIAASRVAKAQAAPDTHSKDRAAITQLITSQQLSWNKGDIDTFVKAYWHSPDLTFSGTRGTERGYESVLEHYKKAYPDRSTMGQLDFSDL